MGSKQGYLLLGLLCYVSLCKSENSPLTGYANYLEEKLEDRNGQSFDEEVFMGIKEYESKLAMSLNPGCNYKNCSLKNGAAISILNLTVVNTPVQQVEHHWLWSVIGHPTLQGAISDPGNHVKINWNAIFGYGPLNRAISYEAEPIYSGAIMLLNLIEFNDTVGTGILPNTTTNEQISFPMTNFFWERKVLENSTQRIRVQFVGLNYTKANSSQNTLSGRINITISGYAEDGFGTWLPHLCHSQRTNQMDIQLDNLESNSGFNQSRFALQFVVASDIDMLDARNNITWQTTTTLDDEHTPGIFKTEELVIPGRNETLKSYLQWRPVVYTTTVRDLSESTGVYVGTPLDIPTPASLLNTSLLYALYGEDLNYMLVKTFNVSLGSKGDGFYKKTKFQAWTFTYGMGQPLRNGFSPIVILVMTIMVAVLLVVFVAAGIICGIKKWQKQTGNVLQVLPTNPPYSRLN